MKRYIGAGVAAVVIAGLAACGGEKQESDPQRAQIESSIRGFIDSFNDIDLAGLKTRICGPLADEYAAVRTNNDLRRIVDSGMKYHGKTTVGTITTTSASNTQATAKVQVIYVRATSTAADPVLATVEVNKIDHQWKVCRFDRDSRSSSTESSPAR